MARLKGLEIEAADVIYNTYVCCNTHVLLAVCVQS